MIIGINLDDAQGDYIAFLKDFFGVLNPLLRNLRDVNETFQLAFEACKSTELGQAGNIALYKLANLECSRLV